MKPSEPGVRMGSYPKLKSKQYKEKVGVRGSAFPELEEKGAS